MDKAPEQKTPKKRGRKPKGTVMVLPSEQVNAYIKLDVEKGLSYREIMQKYGVSAIRIADVKFGRVSVPKEELDILRGIESDDLFRLGVKARNLVEGRLDEGKATNIEAIAAMDRAFQQRRLVDGASTENVSVIHAEIQSIREMRAKRAEREMAAATEETK